MKISFLQMLSVLFFYFLQPAAFAQTILVLDKLTGLPVEMAMVVAPEKRLHVFTNANGKADISIFGDAENLEIHRIGYRKNQTTRTSRQDLTIYLTPSPVVSEQVVVSESRWADTKAGITNRIEVLNPALIQLNNPQTAADLLSLTPSVYIQKSQQAGGSPMIRGFSTNRLLYAVDGVRMNSAIFRSGNLHNVISLDPFAIEHTEILFGPGSTLYGSDAIGGVMVFQTLSPVFSISDGVETSGKVSLRTASANDEKTLHAHVKAGGKRWASVTSVSRFDYGDLRMGRHGDDRYLRPSYIVRENGSDVTVTNPNPLVQTPSGYKQLNLMQKLRFKASNHLDLQYGGHYSGTGNFSRYDRLTRPRGTNLRSAEFYYGPQIWGMNVLTATLTKPSALFDDAAIRVAHQYFEESRFDRDRNSVTLRKRLEKVIAFSANADFRAFLADGQVLYYGAEFVTNDVRSRGSNRNIDTGVSVAGPSRYPQATWQSGAVYLRYERTLRENLLFAAGTRWNTFRMDADFSGNAAFFPLPFESARLNNQAITGSAGLFWTPLTNWSVRVSGSTGFRAPNVDDVGKIFDSTPGSVVVPNRELGAEYALNGEIGTAFTLGNVLKLDAAGFYTRLNNALVRRPFTLDGRDSVLYDGVLSRVEAIQNAAFATVYGVQGSVDINLGYGFSAGLAFSWQEGTEELDNGQRDPLRHAAPFSAQTRLEYRNRKVTVQLRTVQMSAVPFRDLALEERAKDWMYAKDADGNPYAPAWRVGNLNTVIRINRKWNLAAGVENLFDVRYRPYSSGITAPGRNIYVTATAAF